MKLTFFWLNGSTSHFSCGRYAPNPVQYIDCLTSFSMSSNSSFLGSTGSVEIDAVIDNSTGLLDSESGGQPIGAIVEVYSGSGTLLATAILIEITRDKQSVSMRISSQGNEFAADDIMSRYALSQETYPGLALLDDGQGGYANFLTGGFTRYNAAAIADNSVKCRRVTAGPGALYILGKVGASMTAKMPVSPDFVTSPNGTNLAGYAFVYTDPYWYVQKAGEATVFDYLDVNFSLTSRHTLAEIFTDVENEFFETFGFASAATDGRTYWPQIFVDPYVGEQIAVNDPRLCLSSATTAVQLLNILCGDIICWNFQSDGKISFHNPYYLEMVNHLKSFQPAVDREFEFSGGVQRGESWNTSIATFGVQPGSGELIEDRVMVSPQSYFYAGAIEKTRQYESRLTSHNLGQYPIHTVSSRLDKAAILSTTSQGQANAVIVSLPEDFGLEIFDVLHFVDSPYFPDDRYFYVTGWDYDFQGQRKTYRLYDVSWLFLSNQNRKFLFQSMSRADNGEVFPQYGTGFSHPSSAVLVSNPALHKLGGSPYTWSYGDFSYKEKSYGRGNNAFQYSDWKIDGDFMLWGWFRATVLNAMQILVRTSPFSAVQNWELRLQANNRFSFRVTNGGVLLYSDASTNFTLADLNWHLVVFVRKSGSTAFYIDGQQVSYMATSYTLPSPYPFAYGLAINGDHTLYTFDCFELLFQADAQGPLTSPLSPNAGITDSHPMPTGAVTWYDGKFINYNTI